MEKILKLIPDYTENMSVTIIHNDLSDIFTGLKQYGLKTNLSITIPDDTVDNKTFLEQNAEIIQEFISFINGDALDTTFDLGISKNKLLKILSKSKSGLIKALLIPKNILKNITLEVRYYSELYDMFFEIYYKDFEKSIDLSELEESHELYPYKKELSKCCSKIKDLLDKKSVQNIIDEYDEENNQGNCFNLTQFFNYLINYCELSLNTDIDLSKIYNNNTYIFPNQILKYHLKLYNNILEGYFTLDGQLIKSDEEEYNETFSINDTPINFGKDDTRYVSGNYSHFWTLYKNLNFLTNLIKHEAFEKLGLTNGTDVSFKVNC